MNELCKLQEELKNSMLAGNWDKAIEIANQMKQMIPSKIPIPLCKSYNEKNGKCNERLYFTPFPGQFITIPCPFYEFGKCKIDGDISSYLFQPTFEDLQKNQILAENIMQI